MTKDYKEVWNEVFDEEVAKGNSQNASKIADESVAANQAYLIDRAMDLLDFPEE